MVVIEQYSNRNSEQAAGTLNRSTLAHSTHTSDFVTIATILGTGILGLPVMLTKSGLYPFLVTFIIDAVIQSLLVHFFTELLQRAIAAQRHDPKEEEAVPLNSMLEDDIDLDSDEDEHTNGAIMKGKMQHIREIPSVQPPNLHLLGKMFLPYGLQQAFDLLIILQFIAILICYALAGSEAYAQLIGIEHFYVIPVFVWVLTLAIVFGLQLIQPIVSILTFLKGSLLLGTAAVTFYVGLQVAEKVHNDFHYIGAPFLMGTVALGGVCNTMPYTFEKVSFKKAQVSKYRTAVQLGLWTCVILNILWCWAVLDIVPQTIEIACHRQYNSYSLHGNASIPGLTGSERVCKGELSLESAELNGKISTLPLTKLLERDYPSFTWVAVLTEIFIMVSITVSYMTIGGALHHTLNGIVQSVMSSRQSSSHSRAKTSKPQTAKWLVKTGLSLGAFTAVFGVAMLDPEGFVDLLEKLVSFSLNFEVGVFVFLMMVISHRGKYRHLEIPLPLSKELYPLVFLLPLFFNFAVVYDVYNTIHDILYPKELVFISFNTTTVTTPAAGNVTINFLHNVTSALPPNLMNTTTTTQFTTLNSTLSLNSTPSAL